jgi:hypothetical protein
MYLRSEMNVKSMQYLKSVSPRRQSSSKSVPPAKYLASCPWWAFSSQASLGVDGLKYSNRLVIFPSNRRTQGLRPKWNVGIKEVTVTDVCDNYILPSALNTFSGVIGTSTQTPIALYTA